ncbi:MAG: sterol desaturase family protein [Deltaproteobacteria bacterium]|nr:sterol desaturase family protein [Deltaproteobacteria bacterium]MBW2343381.1 sterol desaturase family protein [Deltaproteobacteria bacterium]
MFDISESLIRFLLFWGVLLFFLSLELLVPYRPGSVSKVKRWINNLALTLFNSILLNLIFSAAIVFTATYVQTHKMGVLNMVAAPMWLKILVTIAFMDFMLYVWHLLNHEMPLLWRFHRVHHSDLNMDVSSATRFHIGELAISAVIKISLIFFLGASPMGVLIFESVLVLCAQFHHSSLKVPKSFETLWWILFVPPSMHRIHHSVKIKERNSNYGTIFSLWDRILGTLITNVDQNEIRIGVGAYQKPDKLNFHQLLVMPFTRPVR